MRSSGCRPPVSAGRTCGRTAGVDELDRTARDGSRVRRHRRGGRRRRSAPSSRASSSSARSSPPTTPARSAGPATRPPASHREVLGATGGAQAERMRVPLADGTLVATPEVPSDRSGAQLSGCLRRARHRLVRRRRRRGRARARPSPSSVTARSGCSGCWPPQQLGAERIIAMSRHEPRQQLALEFGATDIVDRTRRRRA